MHPTDIFTLAYVLLVASEVLFLADWGQTHSIATNPGRWREIGFARHFIGEHPTTSAVRGYFLAWIVAVLIATLGLLAHALPLWAIAVCVAVILIELVAVIGNLAHDIPMFASRINDPIPDTTQ